MIRLCHLARRRRKFLGFSGSYDKKLLCENEFRVKFTHQDNPNSPTPPFRPILAILASKQGGGRRHENFGILDFGGRRHENFSELGISTYLDPAGGENFGDFEPVSRAFPL